MKGAGWIGILMIGAGVLVIWSGFQGVSPLDVLGSVLRNEPLPASDDDAGSGAPATPGSAGGSGFDDDTAEAGSGNFGGGGGGW